MWITTCDTIIIIGIYQIFYDFSDFVLKFYFLIIGEFGLKSPTERINTLSFDYTPH